MNYSTSTGEQNSFRLFSMGGQDKKGYIGITEKRQQNEGNPPAYQRFQQYSNSPVVESIDPSNRKGREHPGFFCGPARDEKRANTKGLNYLKQSSN